MKKPRKQKMAINNKKIGLYAITGVAIAVIVIVSIFASGVQFPGSSIPETNLPTGTLFVSIKDKPTDLLNLNITLSDLFVHNDDNNTWIQLNFTAGVKEVYFDLLSLQNITKELSVAEIPVGNYSKIRMDVKAANATFEDGTTANLTVPPEHLDVIVKFQITQGHATEVLIDMQADSVAISSSHNLKPVLKATVE